MSNQRQSLNVPLSSNASSSTSESRNKVALKPGRSLMDWIRFSNNAKDLASTRGKILEVSLKELSKHNTVDNAWIALRGKVYNITHYLEYHPGGVDELMRGVGKDGTDLFNQVHQWVNAESMLQKCFVGILKEPWTMDVPKFLQLKFKARKLNIQSNSSDNQEKSNEKKMEKKNAPVTTRWSVKPAFQLEQKDMSINSEEMNDFLKLVVTGLHLKQQGLIIDLVEKELFILAKSSDSYAVKVDLFYPVQERYQVVVEENSHIEISFKKDIYDCFQPDKLFLTPNEIIKSSTCNFIEKSIYWPCKIISKTSINHNTFLYTFLLPLGTKMWVPIGYHVHIKLNIEGSDVIRSYTPVSASLNPSLNDVLDGSKVILMIKNYPRGILTPVLNQYSLGDSILISNYSGSFSEEFIENSDSLVMIAAGTGITPMIRIILWSVHDKEVKRSLQLIFFNKTEEDILWRDELEECRLAHNEFKVDYVLCEPSETWKSYSGLVNKDILNLVIKKDSTFIRQRFLICGPLPFTHSTFSCLKEIGINQDVIYAFTGGS